MDVVSVLRSSYPYICDSIQPVAELIKRMSKINEPCELEARIGFVTGSKFIPGVDAAFVSKLLYKLETSSAWTSVQDWNEQVDRFYAHPTNGRQVRTSTCTVKDTRTDEVTCSVTHITKENIDHIDLKWIDHDGILISSAHGIPFNVRVSLKSETPVHKNELQDRVDEIHLVRIKQRKSFVYAPRGVEWSIDITQVYQSKSYVDAIELLRDGIVSAYEVEVECREPLQHLNTVCAKSAERLSASILLKVADLFESIMGPKIMSTSAKLIPLCA
jgi:hypothetical protein